MFFYARINYHRSPLLTAPCRSIPFASPVVLLLFGSPIISRPEINLLLSFQLAPGPAARPAPAPPRTAANAAEEPAAADRSTFHFSEAMALCPEGNEVTDSEYQSAGPNSFGPLRPAGPLPETPADALAPVDVQAAVPESTDPIPPGLSLLASPQTEEPSGAPSKAPVPAAARPTPIIWEARGAGRGAAVPATPEGVSAGSLGGAVAAAGAAAGTGLPSGSEEVHDSGRHSPSHIGRSLY